MKQLTQELKSGKMEILEVPFPAMGKKEILVRNKYSVISAGTEGKTVIDARKGYIAKARARQKEVKIVLESIKSDGLKNTYDIVMNKLNAPSSLGYSCAGEVIAVGDEINNVKVGDHVACGGSGAVHADIVSIPKNMFVKVDKNVDLRYAAFTTISSIAIQGIRQADLRFGENCVVIGLGLIGLLTMQILESAGIKAIGVDIDSLRVKAALENGIKYAFDRNKDGLLQIISNLTGGYGTDAVIITAATSSTDPINFAGELARKKGKVVVVGAVPTGFERPNYYKKELDLRMSSSYGPGRYDNNYEIKGIDYPVGYVRFTENRNMQTFVDYLSDNKLNIEKIITHEFDLLNAPEAYQMILDKTEPFLGILIKYDAEKQIKKEVILNKNIYNTDDVNVGFIGAGSFAQNSILPRIKGKCNFIGVATAEGNISRYIAGKYNFNYAAESGEKIVNDKNINTVFVVTRHNLHAEYVIKGVKAGKNVYVEKPLAMNIEELESVKKAYESSDNSSIMLGFNRRFSPFIKTIKSKFFDSQSKAITMRINAGAVPADHWVHDPEIGGGRIIGEVCHFIDLAMFIAGSPFQTISAISKKDSNNLMDTVVINVTFKNGSIASINYFSNGNKNVPKEIIEVFCDGLVYKIDDFKEMTEYGNKKKKIRLKGQDKGHTTEFEEYIYSIKNGKILIPFDEIYLSSLATLKVIESIKNNGKVIIL